MDWSHTEAPTIDEMERIARLTYAALPEPFRALCGDVLFLVREFPDEDVMRDLDLESDFDILGLFQGATLAERVSNAGRPEPTSIFLYRRPILDYWAENEETLGAIIRHVIVHEIGHHFGLSDGDMEAIEDA